MPHMSVLTKNGKNSAHRRDCGWKIRLRKENKSPMILPLRGITPACFLRCIELRGEQKSHAHIFVWARIMRPNYQDLNPFIWFLDSLTYRQGNPYILPQYSNNFEIRHSYKNGITTVINYTKQTMRFHNFSFNRTLTNVLLS